MQTEGAERATVSLQSVKPPGVPSLHQQLAGSIATRVDASGGEGFVSMIGAKQTDAVQAAA